MTTLVTRHARPGIRHTIQHRIPAAVVSWTIATAVLLGAQSGFAQPITSRNSDDPFENESWQLELSTHAAVEAWNYNVSHEEMYGWFAGLTYGLRDGLALTAGASLYYVSQRGVDGWLLGTTLGVRGRIYRAGRTSAYLGFEVGVSESDTFVPPRGTRFNYLAIGSAGAVVRVHRGVHAIAAFRWIHVSNNGLAGRHRNPDIEAVGPQLGVVIGF